jgi:alpha/beta superfamily hydrolase
MMERLRSIVGPAGSLEVKLDAPASAARAIAVLAPPHPQLGGTLHDRVVYHAAQGLTRAGCAVLRFNFRGVGASDGDFGQNIGEVEDFRSVVDAARTDRPGLPVWAVGYSFGAWVASTVGADDSRVSLLVAIAPPVDGYDFSRMRDSGKPKFLIHGERDEMTPLKTIRRFYGSLGEPKELVVIDAANHVFDGHVSEVADALEDLLSDL